MDGKKFNKLAKVSKSRKMGKIMVDEDVMGQDPLKGYPFQKKFSVEQSFRNMVETSNLNLSEDDGEGGRFDKSPSEMTPKQRKAKADHDQALRDRDARKKARVAQMQKDKAHADTPAEKERRKKDREKNLRAVGAKGGETHRDYVKRTGGTQTNSFDPQAESNEFNTYRNMIDMWEENLQEDLQEEMISYRVKGMQKPEEQKFIRSAKMMGLKITMDKGSKDTVIVMSGTKKKLRDFDAVARGKSSYGDPSTIKHFDEETVSEGKKIQDIVRKHKRELQKAQRSGNLDLSKKAEDELSNWASSSGEIRGDDEDEFIDWLDSNLDDLVKGKIKEETVSENYRVLAKHGMGAETKNSIKVGTEVDYYQKDGAKYMGKITKMTPKGYIVTLTI
jgi:cell pole-organizing protein PopZ